MAIVFFAINVLYICICIADSVAAFWIALDAYKWQFAQRLEV